MSPYVQRLESLRRAKRDRLNEIGDDDPNRPFTNVELDELGSLLDEIARIDARLESLWKLQRREAARADVEPIGTVSTGDRYFNGQAVWQKREARGMTRTALATAARCSESAIGRFERGEIVPSLYTAGRLAQTLGCIIDELFCSEPLTREVARLTTGSTDSPGLHGDAA